MLCSFVHRVGPFGCWLMKLISLDPLGDSFLLRASKYCLCVARAGCNIVYNEFFFSRHVVRDMSGTCRDSIITVCPDRVLECVRAQQVRCVCVTVSSVGTNGQRTPEQDVCLPTT